MTNSYKLFIGADEAGYGPNLGPLLVAGTVWRVPANLTEQAFCECLGSTFVPRPLATSLKKVPLGDSKRLYKPKSSLKNLEAGLWALLPTQLDADYAAFLREFVQVKGQLLPWYASSFEQACPTAITPAQALALRDVATQCLRMHDTRLLGVRAVAITEGHFNAEVARSGSKGQLLSSTTLQLVSQLRAEYLGQDDDGRCQSCEIFCDRQGGRRNYLPVLQDAMPDSWFQPLRESSSDGTRADSPNRISYEDAESRTRIHFTIGGDSFPPAGLASMLAKYVREQLMSGYNAFWAQRIPGIQATAGYPQDAKRFRAEVASDVVQLGVQIEDWWRSK